MAAARRGSIPRTPSGHRLRLGLPGYLIPFAPLAFAPERQVPARTLPSPLVFFRISTHFTTPPGVPCPSLALKCCPIRRPSSCTRRCSVRLASIAENSSLLPPVGVWAVLNPSVADRPLRPATDRRLGELLPHQPANRPRAHLPAPFAELCLALVPERQAYAGLSAISRRYPSLKGR